jgi:hypothetical protein
MTEHADAPSNAAHLFKIIRTTRSMRRLKPDPVPNGTNCLKNPGGGRLCTERRKYAALAFPGNPRSEG